MRMRIIDAFTDEPFAGNPAAVCLLPEGPWPDEGWMAKVGAEMNLSETAFLRPLGERRWAIRWFTPAVEVDLCGHATLAATHALASDGLVGPGGEVVFESNSGELRATVAEDGAITLDFPANQPKPGVAPAELAKALGSDAWIGVWQTGALGDLMLEFVDEASVRALRPDHTRLAALVDVGIPRGVIVTARADEPEASGYDFVSRWFGTGVDVGEDPVTGSAHTALLPLWVAHLNRDTLVARQVSRRGGTIRLHLEGERVLLKGTAVTMLDGSLAQSARP
ncbi:PhzF family phenazine biosynthesis protein [Streptacidiphilus sp. MAP12-33]|uniref:PhzF family phenazine biosynthesis protein n=1 Tax=Streptacidiphilus sp. MAP12-33 TaxID=3156266 RepID=UPI003512CB63